MAKIINKAGNISGVATKATKKGLKRAGEEIRLVLSDFEDLILQKKILNDISGEKRESILGKEVYTDDGSFLGIVEDIRVDLPGHKVWLVIVNRFGRRVGIELEVVKSIRDSIILSAN